MIRYCLAAAIAACAALSAGVSQAVVLNGTYTVNPTTDQIGIVNDLPGITNLVLASGVPQRVDLFDIFSVAPIDAQPISVTFDLTEAGGGALLGAVEGSIVGLPGPDDAGRVMFTPADFLLPDGQGLNISLSSADFAGDFNGTVLATFLVPEPSSLALLGLGLVCFGAASLRGFGAHWRPLRFARERTEP